MSLEQPPIHSHYQEGHFTTSFAALDQLRKEDVLTDITLVAAENLSCLPVRTVRAHKLVLMAVSDYFRTMFKGEYSQVAWSLFLDQRCHLTKFFGVVIKGEVVLNNYLTYKEATLYHRHLHKTNSCSSRFPANLGLVLT